jgi:hypothetical protein
VIPAQRKQLIRHARAAVAGRNYDSLVAYVDAYAERARQSAGNLLPVIEPGNWYYDRKRSFIGRVWHRFLAALTP